jgi:hypothetical protein
VYDLVEDAPPRSFIEAAERGDDNYIIKAIERTIDFNINQTVRWPAHAVLRHVRRHSPAQTPPTSQANILRNNVCWACAGPHQPHCSSLGC